MSVIRLHWGTNTIRAGRAAPTAGSNVSSVVHSGLCGSQASSLCTLEGCSGVFLCRETSRGPQTGRVSSHSAICLCLYYIVREGPEWSCLFWVKVSSMATGNAGIAGEFTLRWSQQTVVNFLWVMVLLAIGVASLPGKPCEVVCIAYSLVGLWTQVHWSATSL